MQLEIMMGSSGYGKTYRLYENIIKESMKDENISGRYIIVVPEQSSMQAQKDIVRMHPDKGVFNIDVLTFGRMCYRIFEELGIETAENIDDTGKNLIIRMVTDGVAHKLRIIKADRRQGFISEIKSMISELKQYGIKPDGLREIIAGLKSGERLKQKLNDILVIYEAFEEYISGRYSTAEDRPETMLAVMEKSHFFEDAVVAFDGFTGFTPVQYRIIDKIIGTAKKVIITATLPNDEPYNVFRGEEELFAMSKTMIAKAGSIADRLGAEVVYKRLEPDYDRYRFAKSEALDFLEKNIFRYNGKQYAGATQDIRFARPDNPSDELVCTACDILRNVREGGLRFRDIAVVVGDMEMYADEAVRIFIESGIPFFVDAKRTIIGNPLVEYIRAALEVINENYSYESVFRFIKNGLCDIDADEADITENYVIAYGLRGYKTWSGNFVRKYPGKEKNMTTVNAVRRAFTDKLANLTKVIKDSASSVGDYVRAVYDFMEQEQLYERMEALAAKMEASAAGDLCVRAKADGFRQAYGRVVELLEQTDALLGDEKISPAEFAEILDAGFEEIKVGIIPPSADCVTMGDIERTRLEHVKLLYILGVNESVIPATAPVKGVLSENERRVLGDNKVELAPTPREQVFRQNFYLYLNMTEPEKGLYLMSHKFDADGKESKVSRVFSMVRKMYPKAGLTDVNNIASHITNAKASRHLLTERKNMGGGAVQDGTAAALLIYYMNHEPYASDLKKLLSVFTSRDAVDTLSAKASRELYGELKGSSITRIETFAGCAFAHFARYGLELEERQVYELNAADMGTVFHRAIELISEKLAGENRSFADVSQEEIHGLADDAVMEASVDFSQSFFADSSTNAYIKKRITDITECTVWALGKQLQSGAFRPAEFERKFFQQEGQTLITGKIDRVDTASDGDRLHVKIVDYKSGRNRLSLDEIYAGLKLQLMVYLNSMLDKATKDNPGRKIMAAGAFYNHIDNPIATDYKEDTPEGYERALLENMRPAGIVSIESVGLMDDWEDGKSLCAPASKRCGKVTMGQTVFTEEQLRCLSNFAAEKLSELEKQIRSGVVAAEPYEGACDYCPYGSVCGIETGSKTARKIEKISGTPDMWQKFGYKGDKEEQ